MRAGSRRTPSEHGHSKLFVSGEYLRQFRPSSPANPFHEIYEAKREVVIAAVKGRQKQVLDIGGGMGRMALPLSEAHKVTLCDLSIDMLSLAKRKPAGPLLAVADARALPFATGSFDYVLCIDVLPHVNVIEQALGEARRVLRRGGRLLVDSTNSNPVWTLAYPRYLGKRPWRWAQAWAAGGVLPEWRHRVWHRDPKQFVSAIFRAGFDVVTIRTFGPRICPKWHLVEAVRR